MAPVTIAIDLVETKDPIVLILSEGQFHRIRSLFGGAATKAMARKTIRWA
jgi:hypothetical protein